MINDLYFGNFSPVGDVVVFSMCIVVLILVMTSYVTRNRSFAIFLNIIGFLFLASLFDILFHAAYTHITDGDYTKVYLLRMLFHIVLVSILLLYVVYIVELLHLERERKLPIMILSTVLYVGMIAWEIISGINGKGFRIDENGKATEGIRVFLYGYLIYAAIIVFVMMIHRKRLYSQVMYALYGTMIVSFLILYVQSYYGNSSYTVTAFMFPAIALLYSIHSNPYSIELGAVDSRALKDMIRYLYDRKRDFVFMSLYLPDFDMEGKSFPKEIQTLIRKFASEFFFGAVLFQISNGHVVLVAKKSINPDYENKINKLLNVFAEEYEKFKLDYKIISGESIDEISSRNEYISFIRSIQRRMKMNEVHFATYDDVTLFNNYEFILEELEDIYRRNDLRDPRVVAYCQPVYNLETGRYDTAEALMRLKLPDIGLIAPDQFISVAEENGYIHSLTRIILQKTCDEIKSLIDEGYDVKRISINVSILEMRDINFSNDIKGIITGSGIPEDKIAIEITESMSDSDFIYMKGMIGELKDRGVKFYLDDFGTGYSNMERIMELPFDIIKFDRSMVIASDSDERSEQMVGSLADMFSKLNYSVLYEGVESDLDEKRCIDMSASYLQGYKYSRPIPIVELKSFFSKIAE
ncbi:MAG: EAL domain-containing protein [Eubacterium sp.]|nr:EAL domain-containing protein [Eubacterium sp.]